MLEQDDIRTGELVHYYEELRIIGLGFYRISEQQPIYGILRPCKDTGIWLVYSSKIDRMN